jgi:hypothetical protein
MAMAAARAVAPSHLPLRHAGARCGFHVCRDAASEPCRRDAASEPCRPSCGARSRSRRQRFHFAWFRPRPAHVNGVGEGAQLRSRLHLVSSSTL